MDGVALVYCEGLFNSTLGKTAHGLVRFTRRYTVAGVIDSTLVGQDAGEVLDQKPNGIPFYKDLDSALKQRDDITHFVFGIAPDGGRLSSEMRKDILKALKLGLNVDCGLHYYLSDDSEMVAAAHTSGSIIRDIRKAPPFEQLHSYTGRIKEVDSFRIAFLGTDSSVGKRTTAWILLDAFEQRGITTELIATGQTAWLQGAQYGVRMDALVNDFVAGEIENAVLEAWDDKKPQLMLLEGQGSLLNPIYPGGFEILSAAQPHVIIMQHAPKRVDYDGIEHSPIHPLSKQIEAAELIGGIPVIAITVNHEQMSQQEVRSWSEKTAKERDLITLDPLIDDVTPIIDLVLKFMERRS
ncbi:MAG: DUF1611 domain-containing protein [Sphaerochaetaceae bacterium]|jgi:uncharacterized NAD-dependent epimerase/dehydratase family protein